MAQSVKDLTARMIEVDLWSESTTEDQCANCKFYRMMGEPDRGIGYCAQREVDMVVGGDWWCKLWAPDAATEKARTS